MPPPKDPVKYQLYVQRQSESHKGKVSGFKGKTFSPESLQLLRDSHKGQIPWMKGKKHTKETLEIMSKIKLGNTYKRGKKLSPEGVENNRKAHLGQTPWMKGRKHKPETIEINRQKHLGKPSPRKGAVLSESTKNLLREARAKQTFPLKDTKPERILQIALALNGVKFEKHRLFQTGRTFFHQVDIFIEPNLVLEVDGDYWHSLPEVIERDIFNDRNLFDLGNRVIRVREHLIKQNVQGFVESLISCLK